MCSYVAEVEWSVACCLLGHCQIAMRQSRITDVWSQCAPGMIISVSGNPKKHGDANTPSGGDDRVNPLAVSFQLEGCDSNVSSGPPSEAEADDHSTPVVRPERNAHFGPDPAHAERNGRILIDPLSLSSFLSSALPSASYAPVSSVWLFKAQ